MLTENVIRPSESAWASPITLVPKRDGTTRFCVDYRKLNSVTIRDQCPLPQIQDIFDQVGGSNIFSSLDLKAGYWQLAVAEDSIEKTVCRCHLGHYEFLRMPFGLTNAPAVFQRMMDKVLAGLIGRIVMVYLDDIVIYSRSEEEHVQHLELVFARLREAGSRLKPTKCFFGLEEIKLLGYIVNRDGIHTDPEKVKAIAKLTPPRDLKGVRSFLGMTGFYLCHTLFQASNDAGLQKERGLCGSLCHIKITQLSLWCWLYSLYRSQAPHFFIHVRNAEHKNSAVGCITIRVLRYNTIP